MSTAARKRSPRNRPGSDSVAVVAAAAMKRGNPDRGGSPLKGSKRPRGFSDDREGRGGAGTGGGPGHRGSSGGGGGGPGLLERGRRSSAERGGDKGPRRDDRDYASSALAGVRTKRGDGGGGGGNTGGGGGGGSSGRPSAPTAEYKTLLISNLGSQLSDEEIEDGLFREFKKFGDVSVKITLTPAEGRVAYVNFRRADDARDARHAKGRLVLYDRLLKIEAVYLHHQPQQQPQPHHHHHHHRRRSPSPPPTDYGPYGAPGAYPYSMPPPPPPPPPPPRGLSPSPGARGMREQRPRRASLGREEPLARDRGGGDWGGEYGTYESRMRGGGGVYPPNSGRGALRDDDDLHILPEDDQRATRTLFIGNLDTEVTGADLKRIFERFGVVEEVDIKRNIRGHSYGFVKFQNLDMAHRAKVAMSHKVIGRSQVKIGYGKATCTTRLWVGGLGPWIHVGALAREFDRFGTIRSIDYRKGDNFAYIQYESLDAAMAAWAQMRGFHMPGSDRRLRLDFADMEGQIRYPDPQIHPYQPPIDAMPDGYTSHFDNRGRDRTSPLMAGPHYRGGDRGWNHQDGNWGSPNKAGGGRGGGGATFDVYPQADRGRHRDSWPPNERMRDFGGVPGWEDRRRRRTPPPIPPDGYGHRDRSPFEERGRGRRRYGSLDRGRDGGGPSSDSERVAGPDGVRGPVEDKQREPNGCESGRNASQNVERSRRTSDSEHEGRNRVDNSLRTESGKTPQVLSEYAQILNLAWQGVLVLKNSSFPTSMYLVDGDLILARGLLQDCSSGAPATQLKITQRLRLDQPKLDEVTRRVKQAGPDGHCVLLALPSRPNSSEEANKSGDPRPLRNLVSYLKHKQAAGVISLPIGGGGSKEKESVGVLHTFPPCEFSQQYLQEPARTLAKTDEDHLIVVIVRGTA
ncbi:RNA-binding protein 15-like [Petromyzon marinus]|uniref:RNA-binding protein 15-like n=1 Tax=Petromyzon marinus TaxID=7757 RepID=A0AAJ7WU96_PETMA|nr:RNA-binding protein 15-like [Petromyzon marinus]